jgi:hypothetical protein
LVFVGVQVNFVQLLLVICHFAVVIFELILYSFLVKKGLSIELLSIRVVLLILSVELIQIAQFLVSLLRVGVVIELIVLLLSIFVIDLTFIELICKLLGHSGPSMGSTHLLPLLALNLVQFSQIFKLIPLFLHLFRLDDPVHMLI